MGARGEGKGEIRERENREREEKKILWLVRVFETRIYTVLDFSEKFHLFNVLSRIFDLKLV